MNTVRERILLDVSESLERYPWAEHRDLIGITVSAECFLDYEEIESDDNPADFCEVLAIIDKDWLFDVIRNFGTYDIMLENPREYLQNGYFSDDAIGWFENAARTGHLAMLSFN